MQRTHRCSHFCGSEEIFPERPQIGCCLMWMYLSRMIRPYRKRWDAHRRTPAAIMQRRAYASVVLPWATKALSPMPHNTFHYAPPTKVSVLDTTGAGDNFHGAFLYCLTQEVGSGPDTTVLQCLFRPDLSGIGRSGSRADTGRNLAKDGGVNICLWLH